MSQANADIVIRAEKISMIYPGTIALNEVDYRALSRQSERHHRRKWRG